MVEIARVERSIERFGPRFTGRVFTDEECRYCEDKRAGSGQSFALRFAAKEAVSKALGIGIRQGVNFRDIEVASDRLGRPSVSLHGGAAKVAKARGVSRVHLSLSHDGPLAVAFAVAEGVARKAGTSTRQSTKKKNKT